MRPQRGGERGRERLHTIISVAESKLSTLHLAVFFLLSFFLISGWQPGWDFLYLSWRERRKLTLKETEVQNLNTGEKCSLPGIRRMATMFLALKSEQKLGAFSFSLKSPGDTLGPLT